MYLTPLSPMLTSRRSRYSGYSQQSAVSSQQSAVSSQQSAVSVDAMHNLAKLYFQGIGVPQDEMWLAKAAAHGHVIAEQQMAALMQRAKAEG